MSGKENLSDLMAQSLDKIRKVISKKQFEIKQAIDECKNIISLIRVWQLCIESKQVRLVELSLFDIKVCNLQFQNMMELNLIACNERIDQKRVIDLLLDLVLSVESEKEETVQVHMIKCLQALMTSRLYHISGESVPKVFQLLINIYSVSTVQAVSQAAKESSQKIVCSYFQRIEEFGELTQDEALEHLRRVGSPCPRMKAIETAEQFLEGVVRSMVDEVVVYVEKQAQQLSEPQLRVVNSHDKHVVSLINERGIPNGKFGWCIVCRAGASSYCKDTRVPVCSKECKIQHMTQMNTCSALFLQVTQSDQYVNDAYELLDMLCKLSQKEPQKPQLAPMALKCKTIALELIYEALAQGDSILQGKPKFTIIIKDQLLDSLLKNSLSQEKQLLIMTLNIFVQLVWKFRHSMKKEIEAIIQNVYFKFLDSANSSFDHKQYTLKVFNKILTKPKVLLEIFVNYDCSVGQNNLLKKMLDQQCKIIQGRYSKPEYQTSITPPQDAYLKQLCLENFCQIIKQLKVYCEERDKPTEQVITATEVEDLKDNSMMLQSEQVDAQRQMKQELNRAVQKFNFKPELCIKHLISAQYMPNRDPRLFAQFLWENRDLNKDSLGEFFGNEKEFNQQTFSSYVDLMNFKQQFMDDALRNLLDYFTLPGESQQIDRIMQKFASKYVEDNEGVFKSAGASYTLSYLLMMLQTDLHNPLNTEKMTLAQFTNLARGINDGENLTEEVLNGFYDRISKLPLAVHSKELARKALEQANQVDNKKRHQILAKEAEQSLKKWFNDHDNQNDYFFVNSLEHMKFLMETLWSPFFASVSLILEQSEDIKQVQNCFEAIEMAIKLLGRFDLDDEKDTFIFYLQKYFPPLPTTRKQLLGIQSILNIANESGLYLHKSWRVVLQLVSRLETLHSAIKRVKVDAERNYSPEETLIIERLFQMIDYNQLDKIFNASIQLDSDSILDFIKALCELSKEDIQKNKKFLLSKVIEVADYNMGRIKIIWSKMWDIMREHLLEVGSHKNPELALYAIEQLKQLSLKFLQQQELANYQFQREFLLPFEQIFIHSQQTHQFKPQLREYILSCISMITNCCFGSIKSGWKIIMNVVNAALQEDAQSLVILCVQITDKILQVLEVAQEIFMDLIQALIKLTKNKDVSVAVKSIEQLRLLVNYIAHKKNSLLDQIWIPVLSSLAILYSDERQQVQLESVQTLFDLLKEHGSHQNAEFWQMILRGVIRPLFDEIQFSKLQKKRSAELIHQSCHKTFELLQQLVIQQITSMLPCLDDLIDIFVQLILQTQDSLAVLALECLKTIVEIAGVAFTSWDHLVEQIKHVLEVCSPTILKVEIENINSLNIKENVERQNIEEKGLELLAFIPYNEIVLKVFRNHYDQCRNFNQALELRHQIQKYHNYGAEPPSFLTIEFLCARSILKLTKDQDFINQCVQRCLEAQIQFKKQIIDDLSSLTHNQARLVIDKSYRLFNDEIFRIMPKGERSIKWIIELLKGGLDCNVENKAYQHALVDLLEQLVLLQ